MMSISKIRCSNCGYLVRVEMERSELLQREAADSSDNETFRCPKCRVRLRVRWKEAAGKALQHDE
jgi:hypothetical protein